jgi:hypothetical protein
MTARRSSATDLGATLVAALVERDFDRLAGVLATDTRMRALIPPGPVELSGAEPAAARFASWFGDAEGLELVHSGYDKVGDRLHVSYRLRVKRPGDPWKSSNSISSARSTRAASSPSIWSAQASVPMLTTPQTVA